ncbi:Small integral membrane protein 20 [Orchesella cincta]|uniref:Small integral membrane protein 20 n=1 Tax=Orchesella cincta TaxID=48709 RepID=A0A1D2N3L7_ORCCI|nr:Small integral membrane protein 20 [Orchesella cincta]
MLMSSFTVSTMSWAHHRLTGWKFGAFVAVLVGAVGLTIYPIIISPMINPEPYKRAQRHTRQGIKQEEIQPGNMKVWSDPFGRKKKEDGDS